MVSLCLIVKNEEAYLDQLLTSARQHVDEVILVDTGSTDNTKKIAAKHGCRIFDFEWVDDFSAARNFSFSKAKGDWLLWLDADDILQGGEKVRQLAQEASPEIDAIFFEYYYDVDADGAVRTKHWRERLIRNNGAFAWKGRLHETLIETRRTTKVRNEEVKVVHTAKDDRKDEAVQRNIRILKKQLDEEATPDPRTLFYLAACYRDLGQVGDAREMYQLYLQLSGWDEERAQACVQLARIAEEEGDNTKARDYYLKAIAEKPERPGGYVGLGLMYLKAEKFDRAIHWLEMALAKPEPDGMTVYNPLEYTYAPLLYYAEAKFNTGDFDTAIKAAEKAMKFKSDELTKDRVELYKKAKTDKLVTHSIQGLSKYLVDNGEEDKLSHLLNAVPNSQQDNPFVLKLRKRVIPPKVWPKKSVVIFTGASALGEWGPWSLKDGIGGSEEAIIRLSKRLAEQGYSVSVFASPGASRGLIDGVEWRNYWEIDLRDDFDVFVAWRSPWFFDAKINARRKYLWLHDVMEPGEFTQSRLDNLDKVIVLSKYHRSLFPAIPDDKIFLSANGVDVEEFDGQDITRYPEKIVWQSSHVRGLAYLYDMWPAIKEAVPEAELHVMYGWDSFKAVHSDNNERLEWMEKMQRRAKELPGVTEHGKVGQDDIVRHSLSAGLWVYPCPFPEISCITAMKNQVAGAIPVSSDYAALKETVQHGIKVHIPEDEHGDAVWNDTIAGKFQRSIIDLLQHPKKQASIRTKMMQQARNTFSWSTVAAQWIGEFENETSR